MAVMGLPMFILFVLYLSSPVASYSHLYSNFSLDDLCRNVVPTSLWPKDIELAKEKKSAALVKQSHHYANWTLVKSFECTFRVKDVHKTGLFAVIQKMSLRQNPETRECIDYIQFHSGTNLVQKLIGQWNNIQKYCGELGKLQTPASDKPTMNNLAPNAFRNNQGTIDIKIYFSGVKPEFGQNIDIEIAFTTFQTCRGDRGSYRQCGNDTCIYKEYFDDKIVNCPYLHCVDEHGCSVPVDGHGMDSGFALNTRVTVTATTSIFLSFFLFLGCIWLCRYFDMLCWIDRVTGNDSRRDSRTMEMSSVEPVAVPTMTPPDSSDKDLPPAYETLFPDR